MNKKIAWILVLAMLLVSVATVMAADNTKGAPPILQSATVPLNSAHVGATNPGFEVGMCPTPPAGQEGWWGWHFIMPGNNNFTSLTVEFEHAGEFSADPFPGTVFVAHPDHSHAYIWTPTPDTLLAGSATSSGSNNFFNLSHVCPGMYMEELTVTKTAETSFTREHFWEIDKKVETEFGYELDGYPKIWLYTNGDGDETATWTVDVTYEGYVDSGWNVSGEIIIENTGTVDAIITDVEDTLAGSLIDVDCGVEFPYTLPAGATLTCTYDEDGYVEGFNEVTVVTERSSYAAEPVAIIWGDPDEEFYAEVTITDSMAPDDVLPATLYADDYEPGDVITFTYEKDFAWVDYGADGCGSFQYDNTATIVETEQEASATLKVNVQCYVYEYETAYAKGDSAICFIPYFANWGWTNPIMPGTYEMELWAAAGQCNTDNGTLVGSVTVEYDDDGYVTATYNVAAPHMLVETHFYAGETMFPMRRGRPTIAPGSYYNDSPFGGGQVYVIAHAVVRIGMPDPNFGP